MMPAYVSSEPRDAYTLATSAYSLTIKIMKITIKTLQQKVFYVSFIFSPFTSLLNSLIPGRG
jgi:hypothetical protein